MSDFEAYSTELLSSAKKFLENADSETNENEKQRMLRASLTHSFFFLEAQLNYLASHFENSPDFSIVERSLLKEREIELKKGQFILSSRVKFFRLEDRVEFLLGRFVADLEAAKGTWFAELKNSITIRNRLVHPKEAHRLEIADVEKAILSVLGCLSALYKGIFGKDFPLSSLGLHLGPQS